MSAHTIYCWYIVDNSVKGVYCFTWKSHFGCFRLFRGCFRPFRGCFRPKKKHIIKKRRTSPTEHFFSPGSSTRILSEYLKIWIKSLSAWVFSFRRRLIFEVRLKFRPFGRYRYSNKEFWSVSTHLRVSLFSGATWPHVYFYLWYSIGKRFWFKTPPRRSILLGLLGHNLSGLHLEVARGSTLDLGFRVIPVWQNPILLLRPGIALTGGVWLGPPLSWLTLLPSLQYLSSTIYTELPSAGVFDNLHFWTIRLLHFSTTWSYNWLIFLDWLDRVV